MNERPILLLVEDDAALVDSLSFMLELEGFRVKACFLPETALSLRTGPVQFCQPPAFVPITLMTMLHVAPLPAGIVPPLNAA